ncbi:hypothetical protein AM493_01060 [Flavobacterium akiainvivens]|uniref:Uncharacterized protein n=1 Tax=Flavobacterium akiainvivens TaxID=1202724 RepID=A0A0M8MFY2_9FLAO|nr:hypothetical protein [Flavobacterium akiainvivens]KOS04788.1 hypothetical protein AM493_01060 [Flavobacterium akiainvivens]SFQ66258.1 hypothetical protein SAMN05444144_1139 [Flavobacterium akiainvivens]
MARIILLELGDEEIYFDFGTYGIMMFYAKQINSQKGKKLFDSLLSEYSYRVMYDLPLGNITYHNYLAHFVVSEIQEVINFLNDDVIISLNNENLNLLDQYGGVHSFIDMYYLDAGYLENLGLTSDEHFNGSISFLIQQFENLISFYEYALLSNETYTSRID